MKRILIILIIGFVLAKVQAQMNNPLQKGMPNTVTLSTGDVVYDLNGEWDAIYTSNVKYKASAGDFRTSSKDIVRITQEGNQFVGIKLIGDEFVGKNQETVKGELEKNGFRKVYTVAWDKEAYRTKWVSCKGEISQDGNKIEAECRPDIFSIMIIVLKRK